VNIGDEIGEPLDSNAAHLLATACIQPRQVVERVVHTAEHQQHEEDDVAQGGALPHA
jgi:hypothetical protein